jgi:cytochrome c biogenesis factor
VAAVLFTSIALAYMSDRFPLPGDPHLIITSGITRGAIGLFLLTWLVFALPPTFQQARRTASKVVPKLREGGVRVRSNAARARLLGSHLAHLGILLLLIGHVLTTTLVDRSDPSHLVTLERDQPVEHDGYELVFVDTELISADDEAYDFAVGDGFVGVIIEVRLNGELIDTLTPGMLRFDSPSGAINTRSEIDRMTGLTGDTIVILDIFQSNDLLSSMIMGGTDDVETVRVTVHSLRGSHLVWTGWALVMLGGALALASSDRVSQEAE